jgi:hypothetical protein
MANGPKEKTTNWSHLVWGIGGAMAGLWIARNQIEEEKKSRAELDDPEQAQEVYEEMVDLLDGWEPDENCESEDDYTKDLADYLEDNCDWEIQIYENTPEGKPDILIGDLLALELKINPSKNEINRCIGQCAGYSRLWITWMVIIDAGANKIGRLEDLLADKGLDHIEVWDF